MPLSDDKTHYLANSKKGGVVTTGSYTIKGKKYECKNNDCQIMIDLGRGHHNYGVAYYWVLLQGKLKDGRTFMINIGDGFGSEFHSLDKASEDFIVVENKYYKLDLLRLDYDPKDYLKPKVIRTANEDPSKRIFKDRNCELKFEPVGKVKEGLNLGAIAFS